MYSYNFSVSALVMLGVAAPRRPASPFPPLYLLFLLTSRANDSFFCNFHFIIRVLIEKCNCICVCVWVCVVGRGGGGECRERSRGSVGREGNARPLNDVSMDSGGSYICFMHRFIWQINEAAVAHMYLIDTYVCAGVCMCKWRCVCVCWMCVVCVRGSAVFCT